MFKHHFIRKIFTAAAVSAIITAAASIHSSAVVRDRKGDINTDGEVNSVDLSIMSLYLSGRADISKQGFLNSDMDGDGTVDSLDLIKLRRYIISEKEQKESTATSLSLSIIGTAIAAPINGGYPLVSGAPATTVTTAVSGDGFIKAPLSDMQGSLASQGTGRVCIFYVDFPDCPFSYEPTMAEVENAAFADEDTDSDSFPHESINAFYKRSSKGCVELSGNAYRYTTKRYKDAYENDVYKLRLIDELLTNMDDTVDFTGFNGNGDDTVDAIIICVPKAAGDENWWPCAGQYAGSLIEELDGLSLGHIIVGNAEITGENDNSNFVASYIHELGHCMGLPDYYIYGRDVAEGLHGIAGFDTMDELYSDFSCASKLMLGWYKNSQVQVYDYNGPSQQTFTLTDGQSDEGNCVIIPYQNELDGNYCSEYLIMEYSTLNNNNRDLRSVYWWLNLGSGVRIFHVNAAAEEVNGKKDLAYKNGKEESDNDLRGRRFIRLVNDGAEDNFFYQGNAVTYGIPGFAFYTCTGEEYVDPNVDIFIGELKDGSYNITICKKG